MHPAFQTEIEFELPKGYVDRDGSLHRDGLMRLATAADEILPMRDPRVQDNEAYLPVIVLSRVITRLGTLRDVNPGVIEGLFASDMGFLEELYAEFNARGDAAPSSAPAFAPAKGNGAGKANGGLGPHRIAALGEV